jgi:hypothetical protein
MLADAAVLRLVAPEQLLQCAGVRIVVHGDDGSDSSDSRQQQQLAKLRQLGYQQVSSQPCIDSPRVLRLPCAVHQMPVHSTGLHDDIRYQPCNKMPSLACWWDRFCRGAERLVIT